MFDIKYNNVSPSTYNMYVATIPTITPSSKARTRQTVPRMDGELLLDDVSNLDAYVDFTLHARRNDLQAKMRAARKWLKGTGVLEISDANDAYYEVKDVSFSSYLKKDETYGRIAVHMEVYPYEFLKSGDTDITSYSTITNDADESRPLYVITGNGSGTLTVNGNAMTFTVSGNLYIDTRRRFAYTISNNTITGADGNVNGDYDGLVLKSGTNTISCTAGTLKVKPRWGYKI